MDRREFVKTLAAGGALLGLGVLLGAGCAEEEEVIDDDLPPEPPPDPDPAAGDGGEAPEGAESAD